MTLLAGLRSFPGVAHAGKRSIGIMGIVSAEPVARARLSTIGISSLFWHRRAGQFSPQVALTAADARGWAQIQLEDIDTWNWD